MSDVCQTFDSLIELGFERREPVYGGETVAYRFHNLGLNATHLIAPPSFRYVVLLRGVLVTDRTVAQVESQIPTDLESAVEAAAWVSYALRSHRADLEPLPDWFIEGEQRWEVVFDRFVSPEERERRRAYAECPKCSINREYARALRRNLREEISWVEGQTEMTLGFDGRVLSIEICGRLHEVVASGDSWPSSYRVVVTPQTELPARFVRSLVEVSVFEGYLCIDRLRWELCEAVP